MEQKTTKTKTSSNSSQTPKNEQKKETSKEPEKIPEKVADKSLCVEKTQADSVPKKLMILKLENGRSLKKTLDDVDGNLINAPYPIAGEKTADDFDDYLNNLGSSKK
ncbi:unnamed protein product [Caenorhabditis angaria]|uniref:Uncharacterized protein n=1 Tax=Caenorhabditis angaria TaxID=860376 RepID=A0A9P1I7M1_9PELO|nr:unnamed protein product [Caenorhabditis angaria]